MRTIYLPRAFAGYEGYIKGLTVLDPWASMLGIIKCKRLETRSWYTNYRGPIAIHASKGIIPKKELRCLFEKNREIYKAFKEFYKVEPLQVSLERYFHRGHIIAIGNLVDVWEITVENQPPEPEFSFGDFTPGRYAWEIDNVKTLGTPIPVLGQQRLWNLKTCVS